MCPGKKRKRESFTKALKRIVDRINNENVFEVNWRSELFREDCESRFRVETLWVVGSYARGALNCGDLDLVAEITVESGVFPFTRRASRAILGSVPDVMLYIGTPNENSSGIEFLGAKVVWSSKSTDWKTAIDDIQEDPTASRYARRYDVLPVRLGQTVNSVEFFEKMVDLHEEGIISWDWIPAEDIRVCIEGWPVELRRFYENLNKWVGTKTLKAAQYAIAWLESIDSPGSWRIHNDKKCHMKHGGSELFIGRPVVDLKLLDSLSCSQLVIVPHLSRRGPNGIWIIRRGRNHPIERAFTGLGAYYLAVNQSPWYVTRDFHLQNQYCPIRTIELFTSKVAAMNFAVERKKDFENDFALDIAYAPSTEFLRIISCCDSVKIDFNPHVLTFDKLRWDSESCGYHKLSSVEDICSSLAPKIFPTR